MYLRVMSWAKFVFRLPPSQKLTLQIFSGNERPSSGSKLLWMDEIPSHRLQLWLVGIYRGIVISGFLGWSRISSIRSICDCTEPNVTKLLPGTTLGLQTLVASLSCGSGFDF